MVKEAEEFADQDKALKSKIDARNQLETFLYNAKSTVEDKAKDKVRRAPPSRRAGGGRAPGGGLLSGARPWGGAVAGGRTAARAPAVRRPGAVLPAPCR
jgi:hypothetical protein